MHILNIIINFAYAKREDWQSDRMRWTRNPVYHFLGIGGLNPSSSALQNMSDDKKGVSKYTPFLYLQCGTAEIKDGFFKKLLFQYRTSFVFFCRNENNM